MYLTKTPSLLRWLYPDLIWHKSRTDKRIYLTFDDGPIPLVTPFVLKTLKSVNAKATFFCIGDNINKHPEIFNQVKKEGHRIGNHTFNHLRGWKTDDRTYMANIQKCNELMHSNLFRPPYGRIKRSQIASLKSTFPGINIIMWDILSGDFDADLHAEKCLHNVIKHTKSGSIVVFHDSIKAYPRLEYVLPRALEIWTKAGFRFATL